LFFLSRIVFRWRRWCGLLQETGDALNFVGGCAGGEDLGGEFSRLCLFRFAAFLVLLP